MAAKRRRRGDYTEQEIRAENREWVRHLMQLANIDSNKKGGSKVFGAARKLAAECCPEEFRERVQKLPFKANTRTVHAVACDEIIREVQGPREAEAAEAAEEEPRLRQRKKAPPRAPARPEAAPPERPRQGLQRYFAGSLAMQERPPERRRVLRKPQLGQEDPKGHYKALQLTRDASIAEVHKAYRRRALETHPDKGGSEQAFRLVREAFELLSDVAKRRAYDGSGGEVSGDFEEESDGAKSVLAALLMNLLDKEVVSFLEVPVLENVRLLLKQMVERSSESGSRASAAQTPRGTGLVRRANGEYDVKVSWACFSIQALRIGDLQTACTLQSAFAKARERARQRISKEVDEAAPPLTVEELYAVMVEQPWPVQFATDFSAKRAGGEVDRWQSRWTTRLTTAMMWRRNMRQEIGKSDAAKRNAAKDAQSLLASAEREWSARHVEELSSLVAEQIHRKKTAMAECAAATRALQEHATHPAVLQERLCRVMRALAKEKQSREEDGRLLAEAQEELQVKSLRCRNQQIEIEHLHNKVLQLSKHHVAAQSQERKNERMRSTLSSVARIRP